MRNLLKILLPTLIITCGFVLLYMVIYVIAFKIGESWR